MSARGSIIRTGFQPIRTGDAPEAVCDLRFGLIGQGFASLRSPAPFIGADAGHGERLPARYPRHEIHIPNHAARRGLSLSVHGLSIGHRQSSVTLQAKGYAQ